MSWSKIVSGELRDTPAPAAPRSFRGAVKERELAQAQSTVAVLEAEWAALEKAAHELRKKVEEESECVTVEERRLAADEGELCWKAEKQAELCRDAVALETFVAGGGDLAQIPSVMDVYTYDPEYPM